MAPRVLIFEKIIGIFKLSNLRSYQKQALNYILDGKDCFLSQPTGSGKSLVFQALPYCFFLDKQPEEFVKNSTREEILTSCDKVVLVVSPLVSLMKDQVKNLTEKGISATALVENISEELIEQVNYL